MVLVPCNQTQEEQFLFQVLCPEIPVDLYAYG